MRLYRHETDGGAVYLMDTFIECPNGEREGVIEGTQYVVRLDGEPELTVTANNELLAALKRLQIQASHANDLQHAGVALGPGIWSDLYESCNHARAAIAKATAS